MTGVVCTRFTFVIGVDGQELALSRPAHVWVKYYEHFVIAIALLQGNWQQFQ